MKVAVTGSEGLIGKKLLQSLKLEGHKVIECTRENCDVLNKEQVMKAIKGAQIVIHCAAQLDEEAKNLYEVNVGGTENVLEACEKNGVDQFIFLSTVGIYSSAPGLKDENTPPAPQTDYEKSKMEAERKVLSFQEVFNVTILRPALVLGENKYWKQIITTIRKNYPLIGEGKNRWQLVCDSDVVGAVIFCINREEAFGETFIVAEKESNTLEEIALLIRKELGMGANLGKIPLWLGLAIAHINSFLNFNPILKPAYVKRMQTERLYSTKKLEALGWIAECSTRKRLPEVVAKYSKE